MHGLASSDGSGAGTTVFWVAITVIAYLIPTIITFIRRGGVFNRRRIILTNVFLGWTGVGWIIALVLAVLSPRPRQPH